MYVEAHTTAEGRTRYDIPLFQRSFVLAACPEPLHDIHETVREVIHQLGAATHGHADVWRDDELSIVGATRRLAMVREVFFNTICHSWRSINSVEAEKATREWGRKALRTAADVAVDIFTMERPEALRLAVECTAAGATNAYEAFGYDATDAAAARRVFGIADADSPAADMWKK